MKLTYTYDHYYLYEEYSEILKTWAEKMPGFTRITDIGTSYEGRTIQVMEITDLSTGDFSEKPAMYIEGNIHAGEVTGSMTVMRLMDTLLSNTDDEKISALLKKQTFYLLPRVSPDGSEYYLTTPFTLRSSKHMYPYEQEMPGLQPRDLDGDGVIRNMRVKTPYGMWKTSPLDPRLMTLRRPDDVEGDFYNLYQEGEILEYDGHQIAPAPQKFGRDFNRSYPYAWKPNWEQFGGGDVPMDEPENKANAGFLRAHKNICAVVDMHTFGGMLLYTPGWQSGKKANFEDQELYRRIGEMGKEEMGYPLLQIYDEFMPQSEPETFGGFDDFCHHILGIPCFTIECWDVEARAGMEVTFPPNEQETEETRCQNEYKLLKWIDENVPEGEGFMDWTPFEHPQLGQVEIGGINMKFIEQNPPKKFLAEDIDKHVRFILRGAHTLPRLVIDEIKAEKLSEDLYRVSAIVGNHGFMPTYVFNEALKNRTLPELKAVITGAEVVEGKPETKLGHLKGFANEDTMGWVIPAVTRGGCQRTKKVSWIVRGQAGTRVKVSCGSPRTGSVQAETTL